MKLSRLQKKFWLPLILIVLLAILIGLVWQKTQTGISSGIAGQVFVGPQCPVVFEGEDCPDKPYQTRLALTSADGTRVISEFATDEQGMFSLDLPPGSYAFRSAAAANILPYCASNGPITVEPGKYTAITISCDSGIR